MDEVTEDKEVKDTLIVRGLGRALDGEYECDILALITYGGKGAMTNREQNLVKKLSGIAGLRLSDALVEGDTDVLMALGVVALQREGKNVDIDDVLDAPMGAGIDWKIAKRDDPEDDDEDGPPDQPGKPDDA